MDGLLSFLIFAGLFFLMMRFGCGSHIAHGGHGHRHGEHAGHDEHGTVSGNVMYTCPMHPEVRQPSPGRCPQCGMTLVQSTEKGGE